ncbi:MAG: heat-inducible transcriptional repressor HrcA [Bacilli bacterium]|nr:heat-inducible transcriptional repressor HrcA [Bacilli bacterium]
MTRRDGILKLIVEYFIKTAEPVGSKTLMEAYSLDVSSATIRNEMNALEKDGLLEKTHTSSGRVPSEKGYQYYVEHLRSGGVDEKAKNALQTLLSKKSKSIEEVLKESCEILSDMTNLASAVIGQEADEEKLVSIQIIPISENTVTAVFVTDRGYVESKTFLIEKNAKMSDVVKTVKLLNDRLCGTTLSEIVAKMEAMKPALNDYMMGQELIYQAILAVFAKFASERMSLYGKESLYNQPEFANDAEKLRALLSFLDDQDKIKEILQATNYAVPGGVALQIGMKENEATNNLALVSTQVSVPGIPNAILTILGPTRMDYDKVVSTMKYFADELQAYFSQEEKGDKSCSTKRKTTKKTTSSSKKKK